MYPINLLDSNVSKDKTNRYCSSQVLGYYLNTIHFPFNHVNIRKSFSMALNRQKHVDFCSEAEVVAYTPLPYQISQCLDSPAKLQQDETKAKKLFDETLDKIGMEIDDFPTMHIFTSKFYYQSAKISKSQWEKVLDVKCTIEIVELVDLIKRWRRGNYQIALLSWVSWIDDPIYVLQSFQYENYKINPVKWTNYDFRHYLDQSMCTKDLTKRAELLMKAEEILIEEAVTIPIFYI